MVGHDNEGAIRIYERLGFRGHCPTGLARRVSLASRCTILPAEGIMRRMVDAASER